MQTLLAWDTKLFYVINGLGVPWLDPSARFLASHEAWYLLLSIALTIIIAKKQWKVLGALALILFTLGITDAINTYVLKYSFQRTRPCIVLPGVRVVAEACVNRPSFPSNHAANGMACAFLSVLIFRNRWTGILVFLAFLSGSNRIYQGLHYPGDVLAGFLVGVGTASFVYFVIRPAGLALWRKIPRRRSSQNVI